MVPDGNSIWIGMQGPGGVDPASSPNAPSSSKGLPEVQGADFARILEELVAAAGNLGAHASNEKMADPESLKDAVADAKESLDTAISLGENLLEAYRKALITDPQKPENFQGNR